MCEGEIPRINIILNKMVLILILNGSDLQNDEVWKPLL
jgi:hypothetical protein